MAQTPARAALLPAAALGLLLAGGCATRHVIPNTGIADTTSNREVLKTVERYRLAMERRDVPQLITMADRHYFADGGTPRPDDDYGYEGLKGVLTRRLQQLRSLRYDLQYRDIVVEGNRARVDVYVDASWVWQGERADKVGRMAEHQRFELVTDGRRWLFVRGM